MSTQQNQLRFDGLENDFFWNLEARMDKIDDQIINLYFGRSAEGRKKLSQAVDEAITLIRRLFCDWVMTFNIEESQDVGVTMKNCLRCVDNDFCGEAARAVRYDSDFIWQTEPWPMREYILSEKDKNAIKLSELCKF